ncbi:hypothetical protein E5D57_003650 [Metarhizium anisopliae]|nr:hypothetical protein E5D57_003650 [Metarhizium anisopliae]
MEILAHISSDDGRYAEHLAAGRRTISNLRGFAPIQLHKIVDRVPEKTTRIQPPKWKMVYRRPTASAKN